MRCDEVQNRIVEYIENELDANERDAFDRHMAECEACASELAAYQRTMTLLEDDGYVEPDPFYWTRFEAGLRARMRHGRRGFVWIPGFENLAPKLAPIAVAVLFFAIGLGVGLQPATQVADAPDNAASYAESSFDDRGPVISPRSKSLVESGLPRETAQFAVGGADTLAPESFDSAIEQPRMILATEETSTEAERILSDRLLGQ